MAIDGKKQNQTEIAKSRQDAKAAVEAGEKERRDGRLSEALLHYQRAVALDPNCAGGHYGISVVMRERLAWDEAIAAAAEATRLDPSRSNYWYQLGRAYRGGDPDRAIAAYERALALTPDDALARFGLSFPLLQTGRWQEGFAAYEARIDIPGLLPRGQRAAPGALAGVPWCGEPLEGKTLFLEAEQGLGDGIQFVRFIPALMAQKPEKIVFEVHPILVDLLHASFAQFAPRLEIIGRSSEWPQADHLPKTDYRCLLMSLPHILALGLETLSAPPSYLTPPADLAAAWRRVIGDMALPGRLRVGLAWAGNPQNTLDGLRSIDPAQFLPLLRDYAVAWFSLQMPPDPSTVLTLPEGIHDLGSHIRSSADMAAMMMSLDLIISVDTAPLHLAGALGRPAFGLIPYAPDWRWLMDRSDCPWYPSVRLFRQSTAGDWNGPIDAVLRAVDLFQAPPLPILSERTSPLALCALAEKFLERGENVRARSVLVACLGLFPEDEGALTLLGITHSRLGENGDAEKYFKRALRRSPESVQNYFNLGTAQLSLKQYDAALATFQDGLRRDEKNIPLLCNAGIALRHLDRQEDSCVYFLRALEIEPNVPQACFNLGLSYHDLGRPQEALATFERAKTLAPGRADCDLNMAYAFLKLGRWQEGFAAYEARYDFKELLRRGPRPLPGERWVGQSLAGKRLFIECEQGLGDTLQFMRFVSLLLAQSPAAITIEVQEPLESLFRHNLQSIDPRITIFPRAPDWRTADTLPPADYHCLMMSLAHCLGVTRETLAPQPPYLTVPTDLVEKRRALIDGLAASGTLKVGLVWAGNPDHYNDRKRSIALASLTSLFNVQSISLFSLYMKQTEKDDQLDHLPPGLHDLGRHIQDVLDMAAMMMSLDLIISVDTAPLHLAGALGRPVFALLPKVGEWRWMMDRSDSPWYPTLRLFRQSTAGDWDGVLKEIRTAIEDFSPLAKAEALDSAVQKHEAGDFSAAEALCRARLLHGAADTATWRLYGGTLAALNRPDEALTAFAHMLALAPHIAEHYFIYGTMLMNMKRHADALAAFQAALARDPNDIKSLGNGGVVLRALRRPQEAAMLLHAAARLAPTVPQTFYTLGLALYEQGRPLEALAAYRHLERLKPQDRQVDLLKALPLLMLGRWQEGFKAFEARRHFGAQVGGLRQLPDPYWQGESLLGKRILVAAEQGIGDSLQFARYLPMLVARGATDVIVDTPKPLVALFRESFSAIPQITIVERPDDWRDQTALPPADYYCLLMSLPNHLVIDETTLCPAIPYLRPPSQLMSAWRKAIEGAVAKNRLKVGLAWAGSLLHPDDALRSLPLEQMAELLDEEGVSFFSLHMRRDANDDTLGRLPKGMFDLGSQVRDSAEMAAMMESLDLIISVDTAVLHLAGALGRPAFGLMRHVGDWRWLIHRQDSPWYPTIQLFRQEKAGEWGPVLANVRQALRRFKTDRRLPAALSNPGRISSPPSADRDAEIIDGEVWAEVETACRRLLVREPENARGRYRLGLALARQERSIEALAHFERVLESIDNAEIWMEYGLVLMTLARHTDAIDAFDQVLKRNPGAAPALCEKGRALGRLGRRQDAIKVFKQAIDVDPNNATAHYGLGLNYEELGYPEEALAAMETARRYAPGLINAELGMAFSLLKLGRWQEGFAAYERRYQFGGVLKRGERKLPGRIWTGAPLTGKTLFIEAEQGLGDTIQFARFLPRVMAQRPARVILEVQSALTELLRHSFAALAPSLEIIQRKPLWPNDRGLPEADYHCLILSLAHGLGVTLKTLSLQPPYLSIPPAYRTRWQSVIAEHGPRRRPRVGLVWSGSQLHPGDAQRSMPFSEIVSLLDIRGFDFFSLNMTGQAAAAQATPLPSEIIDLGPEIRDCADMGAILLNLDLLISVDTAPVHLAGALGIPCFVLLPFASDWRWLMHRSDSPWYPSLRLFRQKVHGDWKKPMTALKSAVAAFFEDKRHQ